MSTQAPRRLRVAVVGGGAAGIAASHGLQRFHDVTLFEASGDLGGHAHAVAVDDGRGGSVDVDTAFLIYNQLYYPSFVAFLRELGVEGSTQPAEMSASFVDDDRDVHYALSRGPGALFAHRRNLLRPAFHRIFIDLVAFRRRAYADVTSGHMDTSLTLRSYLRPYSDLFRDCFVVPLASAIWSLPEGLILDYPALPILEFFRNHHLLKGTSGDAWRTFAGGSGIYVRAFEKGFKGRVRKNTPVRSIARRGGKDGIDIVLDDGRERFDRVVLATHADLSLRLLADASEDERKALGPWTYHPNTVILHTDARVVSPDKRLWASWNIVTRARRQVVTYYLNRVQSLDCRPDYFLTLGGNEIDPAREVQRFSYRHPIFRAESVATQPQIAKLNGQCGTYFCGSYTGHGFHEDAVASALRVVASFAEIERH